MKSDALSYTAIAITVIVCATVLVISIFTPLISPRSMTNGPVVTGTNAEILDQLQRINHRLEILEATRATGTTPSPTSTMPPTNAMTAPAATTKILFKDAANRFSIVVPSSCTKLIVTPVHNGNANEPLLPAEALMVGVSSYKNWHQFYIMTNAQYETYERQYGDTPGTISRSWKLNDGSYLAYFSPQDGPTDTDLSNCTWTISDASGQKVLQPSP